MANIDKIRYNGIDYDIGSIGTAPIGSIFLYTSDTIPLGYMKCDGSAISRSSYSELFSVIGTTFGTGDGSTTFNLPNMSGRVPLGVDSNDTNFNALGKTYGEKTHILTIDEMPSHSHDLAGSTRTGTNDFMVYGNSRESTGFDVALPKGGDQPHNNIQPSIALNYIIKVKAVANDLDTYSTTEQIIGTWFGKPLYQKTIHLSSLPNNSSVTYQLNLSNTTNIELAYIDEGNSFLIPTGGGQSVTMQYVREDDLSRQLRFNLQYGGTTGQVIISTRNDYSSYQAYLTVKYTKTTDTANN